MSKIYRVRIINFPSIGEKRWCNHTRTTDINEAYSFRLQKEQTTTRSDYKYIVEEYVKGQTT